MIDSTPRHSVKYPHKQFYEEVIMPIGGIYSEQRCCVPGCGKKLTDNRKNAVCCPDHPQCVATDLDVRVRGTHITCHSYKNAGDILAGLRFKIREGSYDDRDYKKDAPLGLSSLSESYLKDQIKKRSYKKMVWHLNYAKNHFQNKNIKDIAEGELDDFYKSLPEHLSEKTKNNIFATLHRFWVWVKRRERRRNPKFEIPEFPVIDFELRWRKIVDKETQLLILEEVKKITADIIPRVYIACLWLITYSHVRGIEIINIKEKDIDLRMGRIPIYRNKEKKPKKIDLIQEDIDYLKSQPLSFPELYFFRHLNKIPGLPYSKVGKQFGEALLGSWWNKACKNLEVEGVPLYPGTRHSTLSDIADKYGEEAAQEQSEHTTSKAFKKYIAGNKESKKHFYAYARSGKEKVKNFGGQKVSQISEFKDKR